MECEQMFNLCATHLTHADPGWVHIIPIHHLGIHLWARTHVHGNPKEYANWYDEHLMGTLSHIAKLAYPSVYEKRILSSFPQVERAARGI